MMICETAKKGECEYEWAGPCDRRSPHDQDGYCFTPKCVSDGTRCTERCVPETPEYVRVTKCSDRWMWHYGRIGEIFPVVEEAMHGYVVEIPRHSWISKLDCEPYEAPSTSESCGNGWEREHEKMVELHEAYRRSREAEEEAKAESLRRFCSDCRYQNFPEDAYPCDVCDPSNNKWEPKKETPMKYKQLKPISLEKLWDAQTAKACVDFLKEWAVFMNWIAQSNRCPTWDTEFDHTFGTFMRDMKNNPHATTWLGYLEKHGFIKKEFEPFEITLPVNFEERLMKSIQAWPLRIDRHSVWGEAICDQLKAHGIKV